MARVDRTVIGIFGRINAGKSTLMNRLTQQETSIVDAAPGTTADVKSALMEIHAVGPVRLLDTAGLDEGAGLGEKKRRKTLAALEEADLALLVVDPVEALLSGSLEVERRVASMCRSLGVRLAVIYNIFADNEERLAVSSATEEEALEYCRTAIPDRSAVPEVRLDLSDPASAGPLAEFVAEARPTGPVPVDLLPFLETTGAVLLHIPLDEESPSGRLLRPQEMAMEYLLRLGVPVGMHRVDLRLARSRSTGLSSPQRRRFLSMLEALEGAEGLQLVLTDSQAMDVMHRWVPQRIPLTTFSIMMVHQTSGGGLPLFIEGAGVLEELRPGDRVLIAEACNHDRIAEDIGTVQIPRQLAEKVPGLKLEHAFGREFPDPEVLRSYRLVIHCGGCMISRQKLRARLGRLASSGVPVTNYGLVLAWLQGPEALERVLEPWKSSLSGGRR
jgi:[FeFe] hydrogenase H-cluster maturation GTPase HydF